jgi:DNA-binding transcriptional MerR regulator
MKHREKGELLRVGELAKVVGKSVRAIHLYEELGLLHPSTRTSGGFRLFGKEAIDRIHWISKLQAIGFSLTEIQGFVRDFESSPTGVEATSRVRNVFSEKLADIRKSIDQMRVIEKDLTAALAYLESCHGCVTTYRPDDCRVCDHNGHELGVAPELFAGLSHVAVPEMEPIHIQVDKSRREPNDAN